MKSHTRSGPDRSVLRLDAGAAADADRDWPGPTSLLVEAAPLSSTPLSLLAIGRPHEVDRHPAATGSIRFRLPQVVVTPGFVNAHAHLDLTHVGPVAYDLASGFPGWLGMVRSARRTDPEDIRASVRLGLAALIDGGCIAVGDIAGGTPAGLQITPAEEAAKSGLLSVTFLEFFGLRGREDLWRARVEAAAGLLRGSGPSRVSLSPHAPMTASRAMFEVGARLARGAGVPIATHVGESPDELEFIRAGTGPQRAFLEGLGLWSDSILTDLGRTPWAYVAPALECCPGVVAHANDCPDEAIGLLSRTASSVAYCPRASAYFGFDRAFGPHRHGDLLSAGVNVCLGTDSIINLPAPAAGLASLGVLDEARLLHARDGAEPRTLLAMATTRGARALGFDESWWRLRPGPIAGLAGVAAGGGFDAPVRTVMASTAPARAFATLLGPTRHLVDRIPPNEPQVASKPPMG